MFAGDDIPRPRHVVRHMVETSIAHLPSAPEFESIREQDRSLGKYADKESVLSYCLPKPQYVYWDYDLVER